MLAGTGMTTSESSPKPLAGQGVFCSKRSFVQQKTYLAMFSGTLTSAKRADIL